MKKDNRKSIGSTAPDESASARRQLSQDLRAKSAQRRRAARFLARLRRAILPAAVLLAATLGAGAKGPGISATIAPAEIALGEAAQLTVTVHGQEETTPEIPAVSGLAFQPVGQSSQIQIINGAMSANISHTYLVTADRLGTFTIPKIRIGNGAGAVESQPVVLKVLQRASGSASAGAPSAQGQNSLIAPTPDDANGELAASEKDSFGFLRLISPKKEFYVGEMVPVELKACFRAGVDLRVDGLPRLNSDAFTMNKLSDQPARSQQIIGGVPYTVFTWQTALTAVKAGDYEMSIEIPTTVTVRQRAQRQRSRTPNPFGDPFFDDFFNDSFFEGFFGTATQKAVTLNSQPSAAKILSLPGENRPPGFAGAVGNFEFAAEAGPTKTAAGDPVTLRMRINGSGNFDRVTAPTLEKNDLWKTYKPSAKFEPQDTIGYSGAKTFEQALVPTQVGEQEVPGLAFSFFDPDKKEYVTRTAAPVKIEVGQSQVVAGLTKRTDGEKESRAAGEVAAPTGLLGTKAEPRPEAGAPGAPANALVPSLRRWVSNPWLAAWILAPAVALVGVWSFVRRQKRLARDPQRLRLRNTRAAVQAQLKIMESAAMQGAAADFFAAARCAFQNQLGLRWNLPPQTITLAEINARMNGEADSFRPILELADEVSYTGRGFSPAELRKWFTTASAELEKLEAA